MSDVVSTQEHPHDPVERWEETFSEGLVATSRHDCSEPWLAGHVHVVRGLPDQPDPVPTGGLSCHQVIVSLASAHITEGIYGAEPYFDGTFQPGKAFVLSREVAEADTRTAWRAPEGSDGFGIASLMLSLGQVAEACRALGLDYAQTEFMPVSHRADPLLEGAARALMAELEGGGPGGRLYAEELLQTVAMHLAAKYTATELQVRRYSSGLPPARLARVKDYVEAHLASEIRLEDLAAEAAMSEYHFARLFKASTGESPYAYVLRRRMERAREMLLAGDAAPRVGDVGCLLGFDDPSHFTRAFKRHFGVTPSRFQKECRR